MRSSISDGWGILLNAQNHLEQTSGGNAEYRSARNQAAMIAAWVRTNQSNFELWAREWAHGEGHYPMYPMYNNDQLYSR